MDTVLKQRLRFGAGSLLGQLQRVRFLLGSEGPRWRVYHGSNGRIFGIDAVSTGYHDGCRWLSGKGGSHDEFCLLSAVLFGRKMVAQAGLAGRGGCWIILLESPRSFEPRFRPRQDIHHRDGPLAHCTGEPMHDLGSWGAGRHRGSRFVSLPMPSIGSGHHSS